MDKMKLMLYSPHQTNAIMLLDRTCHTVYCNGQCIVISATEFSLLWALAEKSRKIVSREDLLQCAWGYNAIGKARTVDVHVRRLREKIEKNSKKTSCIRQKNCYNKGRKG